MPIDQTLRGLALEIDASVDPAPETQPLLEYRFIDLASTQTILARIKGVPISTGGGELAFETSAGASPPTQRMLIDSKGNVGIGTENPKARLEVAGDVILNGPLNVQGALTVTGGAAMDGDLSVIGKLTAASYAGNGAGLSNVTPADASVTNTKLASDPASLGKVTRGSMVVNNDNVGIGTENPAARLEVAGDARFSGSLAVQGALRVSGAAQIGGDLSVTGRLTAASYAGNGAGLSNVAPADNSVSNAKLAMDAASLRKVSGGTMIINGGKVGIGTPDPLRVLQIGRNIDSAFSLEPSDGTPNAAYIRFGDNTGWRLHFARDRERSAGPLNRGPTGLLMTIQDNGNVIVQGSVQARSFPTTSDAKYKTNITPLTKVLEKLDRMRGITFSWNQLYESQNHRAEGMQVGLLAQEVESVFPELVTTSDGGDKTVEYGRLSAVLLEAVKELKANVEVLAQKMVSLES